MKAGDNYIHFTKYGGVNKGTVKSVSELTCVDTKNKITYIKYSIVTNNGILLELDGSDGRIYKIEKELTDENCTNIAQTITNMGQHKQNIEKKIIANREDIILAKGSLLDNLRKSSIIDPPNTQTSVED